MKRYKPVGYGLSNDPQGTYVKLDDVRTLLHQILYVNSDQDAVMSQYLEHVNLLEEVPKLREFFDVRNIDG